MRGCGYAGSVRIDKWLWAARFFKTRSLAGHACELGRVHSGVAAAKPSREVRVGDMLRVKNESGEYQVEVLGLSEMRGPAAVAQGLYRETETSREARMKLIEQKKALGPIDDFVYGKPTKQDRRKIHKFREGY